MALGADRVTIAVRGDEVAVDGLSQWVTVTGGHGPRAEREVSVSE
jgi:hypothetical protein